MKKALRVALVASLFPGVALAAGAPQNLQQLANDVAQMFSNATVDLIVLAIVVYFYGVSTNLFKGEKGHEHLREQLIWGVLVIFLAVSIWGVVQLLQNTVFGQTGANGTGSGSGQTCTSLNCATPFGTTQ